MKNEKIKDLMKKYGSPIYIYEKEKLNLQCKKILKFASELKVNVKMHYSIKANSNLELLKIIKENGICVDAMSPMELNIVEKAGFKKDEILYVCNNVTQRELKEVAEKNILICLDSVSQVETLGSICPNIEIMVRINPGVNGVGHTASVVTAGHKTKFGIIEEDIPNLLEVANKYNLKVVGIHQHLGSLFLNDKIDTYLSGINAGLNIVKKYFKDVRIIDLGGGFGCPYKFDEKELDLSIVSNELSKILQEFNESYGRNIEYKFEPGRFIIAPCGKIYGEVTSIKKNYDTMYIGTNIGMNVIIRPSMYNAYHEIEIISSRKEKEYVEATIVGNLCESGDILGKDRKVLMPNIGDLVVMYVTGAYGYSMSSNYTGRPQPAEVLADGNDYKLIRKEHEIDY